MSERVFIKCLNSQKRIFNLTYGALIGAGFCGGLVGVIFGLLPAFVAGACGFAGGNYISKSIYRGTLQRHLYWVLPYSKDWLDKNSPESSQRNEL